MSTPRFGALVGLALGAIWALAGFGDAVIAGLLSAVGYTIAFALQHRAYLVRILGQVRAGQPPPEEPTIIRPTPRTRTTLQ
ncbi:MAG: hypothetical protein ACRD0K_18935 [Egibacteraceae bacterium]